MPNPLNETKAFLDGDVAAGHLPPGTTKGTAFPEKAITAPHIQYAWDGTPVDADNREDATIRITVWTPGASQPTPRTSPADCAPGSSPGRRRMSGPSSAAPAASPAPTRTPSSRSARSPCCRSCTP